MASWMCHETGLGDLEHQGRRLVLSTRGASPGMWTACFWVSAEEKSCYEKAKRVVASVWTESLPKGTSFTSAPVSVPIRAWLAPGPDVTVLPGVLLAAVSSAAIWSKFGHVPPGVRSRQEIGWAELQKNLAFIPDSLCSAEKSHSSQEPETLRV